MERQGREGCSRTLCMFKNCSRPSCPKIRLSEIVLQMTWSFFEQNCLTTNVEQTLQEPGVVMHNLEVRLNYDLACFYPVFPILRQL